MTLYVRWIHCFRVAMVTYEVSNSVGRAGGDSSWWGQRPGVQSSYQMGGPSQPVCPRRGPWRSHPDHSFWGYTGPGCSAKTSAQYDVSINADGYNYCVFCSCRGYMYELHNWSGQLPGKVKRFLSIHHQWRLSYTWTIGPGFWHYTPI